MAFSSLLPRRCRSRRYPTTITTTTSTNNMATNNHKSSSPVRSPMRQRRSSSPHPPAPRARLNSREIPRTYSGLYGQGGPDGDLMPFELSRNRNTDWILGGGVLLLATYVSLILVGHAIVMIFIAPQTSFTVSHVLHCVITMVYLHWIKGSPNFYEQGEMNAMTLWEQIDSTSGLSKERRTLLVIPTILCYVACHVANYKKDLVLINIIAWGFEIIAKLPFMNGVRLLGINRTTGIDDDDTTEGEKNKTL